MKLYALSFFTDGRPEIEEFEVEETAGGYQSELSHHDHIVKRRDGLPMSVHPEVYYGRSVEELKEVFYAYADHELKRAYDKVKTWERKRVAVEKA